MDIARAGNKYLQDTEPWKLAKTDLDRVATILNVAINVCANLAVAIESFMPFSAAKLAEMIHLDNFNWAELGNFDLIKAGTKLEQPVLLFEKIEDSAVEAQVKRLEDAKAENALKAWKPAPQQTDVDFDTFMKTDIRVGTVLECERVPKSDKLLKFSIDDGMGGRTIVSGIAKYYNPEDLVGRQVCFVANLPERKLRGIPSQGMILSAEDADGRLVVIGPTGDVRPGASVK